jgi:carboxypeptidase Q
VKFHNTLLLLLAAWLCLVGSTKIHSGESAVIAEALKASPLEENLRALTDEIGGRVPGTPAMEKAIAWGVAALKAAGADDVKVEEFQIPQSWAEGSTRIEVTAPTRFHVRAVSLAWTPAVEPMHARFVDVGRGSKEGFAKAGDISGAAILVHSDTMKSWEDLFAEYLRAPAILKAALAGKATMVAFMSTRERALLYRHINGSEGKIEGPPQVLLAREDAERIARLLAAGKKVEADISVPNQIGGPIETANVLAQLRGSERPDEWVLLGAHLDSWELGTGALDDGCNAALVVDALRAIKASGLKPRRSIRFALFSGEEQGLLGSHAYVREHRQELDKADAVIIFDSGSGKVTGFSDGGRTDIVPALKRMAAPLRPWNADNFTNDALYGTDNFDFLLEGVPNVVANQLEANYLENYHAESDTYDKVDQANLKKQVAMAAELSFAIATAPERIGPRQTRAQVEETLRRTQLDVTMKTFGVWPAWESGELGREK